MDAIFQETLNTIIEAVGAVVLVIVTSILLPRLQIAIENKIDNDEYNAAIDNVFNQVTTSVQYIEQTFVTQLKKDGKWNSETQKEALNKAIDAVLKNLSQSTMDYLTNNIDDVTGFIAQQIESKICSSKEK